MHDEYSQYQGRRSRRSDNSKKNPHFPKKLLKQTLFSILIFSAIISPELLGMKFGKKVKTITKSALFYTIDTEIITNTFKSIYPSKGEDTDGTKDTVSKDI